MSFDYFLSFQASAKGQDKPKLLSLGTLKVSCRGDRQGQRCRSTITMPRVLGPNTKNCRHARYLQPVCPLGLSSDHSICWTYLNLASTETISPGSCAYVVVPYLKWSSRLMVQQVTGLLLPMNQISVEETVITIRPEMKFLKLSCTRISPILSFDQGSELNLLMNR